MEFDQYKCIDTLATTLRLNPDEVLEYASGVKGVKVTCLQELNRDEADRLVDILAAMPKYKSGD